MACRDQARPGAGRCDTHRSGPVRSRYALSRASNFDFPGRQRQALQSWLTRLADALHGRIHGFNVSVAHVWAEQERLLDKAGPRMPVEDSYIAATARRRVLDKGQHEQAIAVHERLLAKYPQQAFTWTLARTNALAGRVAEARRTMEGVKATPPRDLLHPWFIAAAYTALGDRDEAVNWLERAYDLRVGFPLNIGRERAAGFDLRPLRSPPTRFQGLLKKLNLTRTGRSAN